MLVAWVTITHPCHLFYDQQVQILSLYQSDELEIIVQFPDDSRARIPASWTDYPTSQQRHPPADRAHLLDLNGLRQVVQLIDHIRRESQERVSHSADTEQGGV